MTGSGQDGAGPGGFTVVELLIAIVVLGIVVAVGVSAYNDFRRASTVRRAAEAVAGDIVLTRSYAVQRRRNVSLVAQEADRTYAIRSPGGPTYSRRSFAADTDVPLTLLDVVTAGDSVTFNSRGLKVTAGTDSISVGRLGEELRVKLNAMGRTKITQP